MKTTLALAALALLASPAWAKHFDGDPKLESSILNVHADHWPHRAGDSHEPGRGSGERYGSILLYLDADHVPHAAGDSHAPEKGSGDTYGSVLEDLRK